MSRPQASGTAAHGRQEQEKGAEPHLLFSEWQLSLQRLYAHALLSGGLGRGEGR